MINAFHRWVLRAWARLSGEDPAASAPENPGKSSTDAPSAPDTPHPAPEAGKCLLPADADPCRAVILSDRAYSAMFADVAHYHPNETGGVFLGQIREGIWYVVEATDPGPNARHARCTHEMDDIYLNHIYHHLRRIYRHGLRPLGFWHRHPGSLDRFSNTDMESNAAHARAVGSGAVSLLVNVDPDFRLTCYYCPLQQDGTVRAVQVPVLVGDRHFADTEFLLPIYPDERIRPVTDQAPVCADKTA